MRSGPRQRREVEHGAVVVAEVAQEPPEPLRAAERAVGDDERAVVDPRPARRRRELGAARQRMASAGAGRRGEVALDVEERGARDVALEVGAPTGFRVVERPAAIDEAVAHV